MVADLTAVDQARRQDPVEAPRIGTVPRSSLRACRQPLLVSRPPLVGAVYGKRARFIALIDLQNHGPWTGPSIPGKPSRCEGAVPLGTVRQCLEHLESGGVVGLFPEGIRVERFGDAGFAEVQPGWRLGPGRPWSRGVTGSDQVLGIDNKFRKGRIR